MTVRILNHESTECSYEIRENDVKPGVGPEITPRAIKYPRKGAPEREVQRGLEVVEEEANTSLSIFYQFLERLAYCRQNDYY